MLISVTTDLHGTIYRQHKHIKALKERIQQNQDSLKALSTQRTLVSDDLAQAKAYRKKLHVALGETSKILESMKILAKGSEMKVAEAIAQLSEAEAAHIVTALLETNAAQALRESPKIAATQSFTELLKTNAAQALVQLSETQATQVFDELLTMNVGQGLNKRSQARVTQALKTLAELSKTKAAIEIVSTRFENYKAAANANSCDIKRFEAQLNSLDLQIDKTGKEIYKRNNILKTLQSTLDKAEEKLARKQEILRILETKQPRFFAHSRLEQEKLAKALIPLITEDFVRHLNEQEDSKRKNHANSPR